MFNVVIPGFPDRLNWCQLPIAYGLFVVPLSLLCHPVSSLRSDFAPSANFSNLLLRRENLAEGGRSIREWVLEFRRKPFMQLPFLFLQVFRSYVDIVNKRDKYDATWNLSNSKRDYRVLHGAMRKRLGDWGSAAGP